MDGREQGSEYLPPNIIDPAMIRSSRGLTLMEVLLTTVLVSLIGATVFQAFNNGIKLWSRSKGLDHDLGAAMFLDRMGDDLRATARITGIPFKGIGSTFSFPAIIWTAADPKSSRAEEGNIDQIGAIEYRYDPAEKRIERRQANYGQALKGQWGTSQNVAFAVEEFLVRYHFRSDRLFLIKSIADESIPAGIAVELVYKEGGSKHHLRRFFSIPVGGGGQ